MIAPETVLNLLAGQFPDDVVAVNADGVHPLAEVTPAGWPRVAAFLRDDPRLGFNLLRCITGVDELEDGYLAAIYDLHAIRRPEKAGGFWPLHAEIAVKVRTPREAPHIPSVADIWPAADWHEREAFDLVGIIFDGHPDLRRILCCEDWEGFPLRKDYEFPLEYHGIPGTTEYAQTRPQH